MVKVTVSLDKNGTVGRCLGMGFLLPMFNAKRQKTVKTLIRYSRSPLPPYLTAPTAAAFHFRTSNWCDRHRPWATESSFSLKAVNET
jgi:hypothetical protein